jgi:hypothetical protein
MGLRQACRGVCLVYRVNRTKTFHVKRFGKVVAKNLTWPQTATHSSIRLDQLRSKLIELSRPEPIQARDRNDSEAKRAIERRGKAPRGARIGG